MEKNSVKVSDYLAQIVGPHHPFVVQGGAAIHMIDSLARGGHKYVCPAHEQAAGMAADGYAKMTGLGVAVTTCGPGACNLLTAAACSWFEHVPVLYLVGQQHDFQEMDVVHIFRNVTKFARQIDNPSEIPHAIAHAIFAAQDGVPGPVLLNIFDEVYRADIEPTKTLPLMWDGVINRHMTFSHTDKVFGNARNFGVYEPEMSQENVFVNPYHFMHELKEHDWSEIVTDIGNHGVWVKQEYDGRVITDNRFGSMGYAIAAAMGVERAKGSCVCITGDGSIQMNIQEMGTIAKHDMNIKIFVLNNAGYGMIRCTQDKWLDARHYGCDIDDLPLVDLERVATAYGIPSRRWETHDDMDFEEVLSRRGPVLVNVLVNPEQGVA